MMTSLTDILLLLSLLTILLPDIVVGICFQPNSTDITDLSNLEQISTLKSSYDINEIVAYSCNSGYGHGYLSVTCKSGPTWSGKSRECGDMQKYGVGSIIGTLCGGFTFIICLFFIIMSTKMRNKRKKDEEVEMKIMDAAVATKA